MVTRGGKWVNDGEMLSARWLTGAPSALVPALSAGLIAVTLAGCAAGTDSSQVAPGSAPTTATAPNDAATPTTVATTRPTSNGVLPTTAAPAVATLHPPVVSGVTWKPRGRVVRGQRSVYVAEVDGGQVGLMWMNPQLLTFRYIPGTTYPENSPTRTIDTEPSTWVPRLAAAFNGAFHLKDDAGGYYYAGTSVKHLQRGLAYFAVTKSGHLKVGVWGKDLSSVAGLEAVRQNLPPLVVHGVSQASPSDDPGQWGLATGGLSTANRSALGVRADGSFVFAYGSEVRASTMARELVAVGVRTAVVLDMNKSWPMGFSYAAPQGGQPPAGRPIQSGVYRDASTYYEQFKKDFVVALVP